MGETEPTGILLRRRHVLEWLGIGRRTFNEWRHCGLLKPVYVGGGLPFYLKSEVIKLVEDAKDEREGTDKEN